LIESYNVKYKYDSICLVSSASCNLNCKYCEIARSKDVSNYANTLQEKIKKSFEDGSYLKNVAITYQKLN
jgi:sulfatase maturation enzyme AslB (radical SAM superfamily)